MKRFHHFSRALVLAISYIMCTHYMLKGQAILIPYLDAEHHTHGYKDNKGNIMITAKYEDAGSFHEDMAAVKLNDKWGFINRHGMEIIPLEYDDPGKDDMFSYFFSDGLAAV